MKRTTCRACGSKKLFSVLDIGETALADRFVIPGEEKSEVTYPLHAVVCEDCYLLQLDYDVPNDELFAHDYAFYTGSSPASLKYFADYAQDTMRRFPKQSREFTFEIASNDGTLLEFFEKGGCGVLGVDPAENVVAKAAEKGIITICAFFESLPENNFSGMFGNPGIIIANNVFAHVIDPQRFLFKVEQLLADDGVFIVEFQHAQKLIDDGLFDNIYHEHRSFFSLLALLPLLDSCGLEAFDVLKTPTQGGSLRVYIQRKNGYEKIRPIVNQVLEEEKQSGLNSLETYKKFKTRCEETKQQVIEIITQALSKGKTVAGYGASAKSTTLLSYLGLSRNQISYIVDKTPYKFGRLSPGTHIPVEEEKNQRPDYYLLLVWNYAEHIIKANHDYLKKGGHFIVPLPQFNVL